MHSIRGGSNLASSGGRVDVDSALALSIAVYFCIQITTTLHRQMRTHTIITQSPPACKTNTLHISYIAGNDFVPGWDVGSFLSALQSPQAVVGKLGHL